jgi:hypothetical protein
MKLERFESEQPHNIESELAEAQARLAKLRAVMHARKIAGLLNESDLRQFMEIDAQVEIVTQALRRYKH